MSSNSCKKVRVCVVGLGFGAAFVPIYQNHPDVEYVGICEKDRTRLNTIGDQLAIKRRHNDISEVLQSGEYDAVHVLSGIPDHAWQCVEVLNADLHCACTVPMGVSIEEIKAIIKAKRESGKNYMMMETSVYTFHFFYAKQMLDNGEYGLIQFLRGAHYQDMEFWPSYWAGLPPMHYSTHAVSPLLAIADSRAKAVHCFGSGVMRDDLHKQYNNPYPIETAIFELEQPGLAAEVTRSLFQTARSYTESFTVYGEKASFEWQIESEDPIIFRQKKHTQDVSGQPGRGLVYSTERVQMPNYADKLPSSIRNFTVKGEFDDLNPQKPAKGGGHHGSHPHLVHEFIRSIVENRRPWIDEIRGADWTAAGICAHESAMNGGKRVEIPDFRY